LVVLKRFRKALTSVRPTKILRLNVAREIKGVRTFCIFKYVYDVVVKRLSSLSHLLMSFLLRYGSGQTDRQAVRHPDTLVTILRSRTPIVAKWRAYSLPFS